MEKDQLDRMGARPMSVPALTPEQKAELARSLVEDFGVDPLQILESAARHLAGLARDRFLAGDARGKSVSVLVGAGGKGRVALAAARRLASWGAATEVLLLRERSRYGEPALALLRTLERMKVEVREPSQPLPSADSDAILEGAVGAGLRGRPREDLADALRWATAQRIPVLSLELPAGMDPATGSVFPPALKATATLALALPHQAAMAHGAEEHRGELYLGDLGVPEMAIRRLGIRAEPLFSESDLIRIS
jgi:NAD(P)H-hydrate epimerase